MKYLAVMMSCEFCGKEATEDSGKIETIYWTSPSDGKDYELDVCSTDRKKLGSKPLKSLIAKSRKVKPEAPAEPEEEEGPTDKYAAYRIGDDYFCPFDLETGTAPDKLSDNACMHSASTGGSLAKHFFHSHGIKFDDARHLYVNAHLQS